MVAGHSKNIPIFDNIVELMEVPFWGGKLQGKIENILI